MNPLRTVPQVDTTIPDITSELYDLEEMPDALAEKIRQLVVDYRKAEAIYTSWQSPAAEINALEEMTEALAVAIRKIKAAPSSLRRHYKGNGASWTAAGQAALDAIAPILAEIEQAKAELTPYLPGRGNPGGTENRDIAIACVVRVLRNAGARDFYKLAERIFATCGITCPRGKAFERAAKKGAAFLDGPPDLRSQDGLERTL
jgi:hypothetical protein